MQPTATFCGSACLSFQTACFQLGECAKGESLARFTLLDFLSSGIALKRSSNVQLKLPLHAFDDVVPSAAWGCCGGGGGGSQHGGAATYRGWRAEAAELRRPLRLDREARTERSKSTQRACVHPLHAVAACTQFSNCLEAPYHARLLHTLAAHHVCYACAPCMRVVRSHAGSVAKSFCILSGAQPHFSVDQWPRHNAHT